MKQRATGSFFPMLAALSIVVGSAGCEMKRVDGPGIHILVTDGADASVSFAFHIEKQTLWWRRRQPADIWTLTVHRPRETRELWRIVARTVPTVERPITYGCVPEGFVQEVPRGGKPPRLEANVLYAVSVVGRGSGATPFSRPTAVEPCRDR